MKTTVARLSATEPSWVRTSCQPVARLDRLAQVGELVGLELHREHLPDPESDLDPGLFRHQ